MRALARRSPSFLTLTTPGQAGPHRILIACGAETIVLDDLPLGDLWRAQVEAN